MRVLHIGSKNYPPNHGGVEKSIYNLTNGLNDYEISSFITVQWGEQSLKEIVKIPEGFFERISKIQETAKRNSIDILHFNLETFIPYALYFKFFSKYKVCITIRGCAWRLKRWPYLYRTIFYILDLFSCMFLDTIFVGKRDYDHFKRFFFWSRLDFVPNGVEEHNFNSFNASSDFIFIGRISPEKNIINMINFANINNINLDIYGPFDKHDPSYEKKVMTLISKCSKIHYKGVLSHDQIFPTLSSYKCFINFSFSEGMPVSVLEAGSVGLSLFLSNIKQHTSLNFPSAKYFDPNNLVDKINVSSIVSSPKNKLHAQKNFLLSLTVRKIYNIYLRLIKHEQRI